MRTDFLKDVFVLLFAVFVVWNFIVFFMYGADKLKAKRQKHRISEKTLLSAAFMFGGPGAFFGMTVFRHKTKHLKFVIFVPLAATLSIVAVALCAYAIFF